MYLQERGKIMKGQMVLERKIGKVLKPFGVHVTLYENFMYNNGWVFFPFFEAPVLGEAHRRWISAHFKVEIPVSEYFLFSLLHEVGHHFTLCELTDEDITEEMVLRTILEISDLSTEEVNEAYFNLNAELLATEWALDFMANNVEWCKSANRKVYQALRHFGNANGWDL